MPEAPDTDHRNEVRLVGRVTSPPQPRTLPSGDEIVSCRVLVARRDGQDVLNCAAWTARARRAVAGWQKGDIVEIDGAVRRRFWRAPGGAPVNSYEIYVTRGRRVAS